MEHTIDALFLKQLEQTPERLAVQDPGHSLTMEQLAELSARIQQVLPDTSLREPVGIVLDHGCFQIGALFACLLKGVCYVPAEPSFPKGRITSMFREAGVKTVLTCREYAPLFDGLDENLIFEDQIPTEENPKLVLNGSPEDPAYILYTSGSTGKPKGVIIRQRNLANYVQAFQNEFHLDENDRMLQLSVCTFDIFCEEVYAGLLNGAALIIPDQKAKSSAQNLLGFVDENQITIISGFPYLLEQFNRIGVLPSSLRILISGGDVLRQVYIDRLQGQCSIYNTYGPSETTVCASYFNVSNAQALPDGTFPIGKPVLNVQMEIRDENDLTVPCGLPGEICIKGNGVGAGYVIDPDPDHAAWKKDPDGSEVYRSGDLGIQREDGTFEFLRRKDHQVMIYGKRVEVEEVQRVLGGCSNIRQAVVSDYTDDQNLPYLCADIAVEPEFDGIQSLRNEMAQQLPSYMIPEFFVLVDSIPFNENGKPDRSRLPRVLKEGSIPWN